MIGRFALNDGVQVDLHLEDTIRNRNAAFYFLALCNCKTEEEQKLVKVVHDVATKYNFYLGDFAEAVNEVLEELR